jgi:hypothetical protein
MTNNIEEVIDTIDAALYSGDTFHDRTLLQEFRKTLKRWLNKTDEIENFLDEEED